MLQPCQRYSLQALASQRFSPETARELALNVACRLAHQTESCTKLIDKLSSAANKPSLASMKNLNHIRYVNKDTHRLTNHIGNNQNLFQRWKRADQHVVKASFEEVRSRHATCIERWVDVVSEFREEEDFVTNDILTRFYGVQLLCDHYVQLHKEGTGQLHHATPNTGGGAVSVDCLVQDCINDAYTEAAAICEAHLQDFPELDGWEGSNVRATVIQPWLHHTLVELLKNAMRASVEHVQTKSSSSPPPPIRVMVEEKPDVVVITVQDRGGGLPIPKDYTESDIERFFLLGHTSEAKRWDRLDEQQSYAAVRSPLSSLGVGLSVSRLMMRHFGGDVTLGPNTIDGIGCMAQIQIATDTSLLEQ